MIKMLWKTCLGFAVIFLGFYLGYFFILQDGNSVYVSLLIFPILFLGGYLVKRGADALEEKSKLQASEGIKDITGYENVLKKNEKLSKDWDRTDQLRTKLKTIQLAGENEVKSRF